MIAALLVALLASSSGEEACPTVAAIVGPPDLVRELTAVLHERGVRTEASASCPTLEVRLARVDDEYRIEIRDPSGRTEERTAKSSSAFAVTGAVRLFSGLHLQLGLNATAALSVKSGSYDADAAGVRGQLGLLWVN